MAKINELDNEIKEYLESKEFKPKTRSIMGTIEGVISNYNEYQEKVASDNCVLTSHKILFHEFTKNYNPFHKPYIEMTEKIKEYDQYTYNHTNDEVWFYFETEDCLVRAMVSYTGQTSFIHGGNFVNPWTETTHQYKYKLSIEFITKENDELGFKPENLIFDYLNVEDEVVKQGFIDRIKIKDGE